MEDPIQASLRFNHLIRSKSQELFKEAGLEWLGGPQGRVVGYLYRHQDQPMTMMDVADRLQVTKPVASQLLKRMERNGLIQIEGDMKDKRRKLVVLSAEGRQKHHKIESFLDVVTEQVLNGVSEEDLAHFLKVLDQLSQNIDQIQIDKGEFDA